MFKRYIKTHTVSTTSFLTLFIDCIRPDHLAPQSSDRVCAVAQAGAPVPTSAASALSADETSDASGNSSDSEASFISDEEAKVSRVADVLRRMFLSPRDDDDNDGSGDANLLLDDGLWDSEEEASDAEAESVWPRTGYPPNSLGLEPPALPPPPPPNNSSRLSSARIVSPVATPRLTRVAPDFAASAFAGLQSPAPIEYAPLEALPEEDAEAAAVTRALREFDGADFTERLAASMRAIVAPCESRADEIDRMAVVAPPALAATDDANVFGDDNDASSSSSSSSAAALSASAVPAAPVLVDETRLAAAVSAQDALGAASAAALAALRTEADRARARVADLLECAQRRETAAAAAKQSFQAQFAEEESQFKQQVGTTCHGYGYSRPQNSC
jgi:hypothetical protein